MPKDVKLNKRKNSSRKSFSQSGGPKIIKTSADRERPAIPRASSVFEDKRHRGRHFDIGDVISSILGFFGSIGDWCAENIKQAIIGSIVLIVLVAALVAVLVVGKDKNKAAKAEEEPQSTEQDSESLDIPEVNLEKDSVSTINTLISDYYKALADADISTLNSFRNVELNDAEKIKIEKEAEYIESFDNIEVYSKPGMTEDTYVVFVYSEAKLKDFDTLVPELKTYIIYSDANGGYYIYEGELSDSEEEYLVGLSAQDDVENLCNTVQAKYNEAVESDSELAEFLSTFAQTINNEVGEALANLETGNESDENETEAETQAIVVKEVEAKETVKVRKSDSTESEELGKLSAGTRVPLIEKKENGWSKVEYNGSEAYVKTEFLVDVLSAEGDTSSNTDNDGLGSGGKVTAKETVRVRKAASTDSDQVGSLAAGDTVDFVGTEGDWSKIKYNGEIAYVKSEFLK